MNNREPLEAAMVGTANFLSKTIMITLKALWMLILVMLEFFSLVFGAMKRSK